MSGVFLNLNCIIEKEKEFIKLELITSKVIYIFFKLTKIRFSNKQCNTN